MSARSADRMRGYGPIDYDRTPSPDRLRRPTSPHGRGISVHIPAVAHHDRLAGKRTGFEARQHEGYLGDILDRGELLIDRVAEHHLLHHILFGDLEIARLFGNLFLDQWCPDEPW